MVTTRGHPSGEELEQLGEKGKVRHNDKRGGGGGKEWRDPACDD